MTIFQTTRPIRRPRLLVEAAQAGTRLALSRRTSNARVSAAQRARIAEREEACEAARRARSPLYRPSRHVELLIALFLAAPSEEAAEKPGRQAPQRLAA